MGCVGSTPSEPDPADHKALAHGDKRLNSTAVSGAAVDVRAAYTFDKVLGRGNFGVVYLVFDKTTGEALACKSISKRKLLNAEDMEDIRREIQIMNHLSGHKNIVNLRATFQDRDCIHLIMDLCLGGELFTTLAARGNITERVAAEAVRDMVKVVHHCHQMNVIHRDLKPENFLFETTDVGAHLKLIDFGLSRFYKDGHKMTDVVGTASYIAPEVIARSYGKESDIWGCGVILHMLLCGRTPFTGNDAKAIFKSVATSPLDLKSAPWPSISEPAKDLVAKMLDRDPAHRLTAKQVLEHPWLADHGLASNAPLTPEVLTRMKQFTRMNILKKEALKVMAQSLPYNMIVGIKQMFEALDEDGSGCITVDELRAGLQKKGADLALQEVQKIVDAIDINGSSKIEYEEFLAATMNLNKLNREENMVAAFKHFDKQGDGCITYAALEESLKSLGESPEAIAELLAAVDRKGTGMVDYEAFCQMMRQDNFDELQHAAKALKHLEFVEPDPPPATLWQSMSLRGRKQTGHQKAHFVSLRGHKSLRV